MGVVESVVGNVAIAGMIAGVVSTIFVVTVLAAMVFKSQLIIRISELVVALIFVPIVLFAFPGGIGFIVVVGLVILGIVGALGYFNIFKERFSCCIFGTIDPGICNYASLILAVLILLSLVAAGGVIIGVIILAIALIIVAVLGGGEIAAAARVAGGAARAGAAVPGALAPEAEAQAALKKMATEAAGVPGAAPGAAPAAAPTAAAGAEAEVAKAAEQAMSKRATIQKDVDSVQGEIDKVQRLYDIAKGNFETSKDMKDQAGMTAAQKYIDQHLAKLNELKNKKRGLMLEQGVAEAGEAGKKLFGGGKKLFGVIPTNVKTYCAVIAIIAAIFLAVVFLTPATSPAGQALQGVRDTFNVITSSIFTVIGDTLSNLMAAVIGQFTTCEVGSTGLACRLLQFKSCEPFCISQTGEPSWKGFEITQMAVVPQTIFDYQKFSILAEFTNNGEGEAIFSGVSTPRFGYYVSGDNPLCEWNIFGALVWDFGCRKVFPIKQEQPDITQITSGKCALPGGKLAAPCVLSPKDSTQTRWLGFEVEPNIVPKGQTMKPNIVISVPYQFIVPNDLVGTVPVQTIGEQVTAALSLKKEGQIVQKINKAYSPPGPLMMAMGTAERQVISEIPTVFLIQFANKGKGLVDYGDGTGISKDAVRVYLPPEFVPYSQDLCDFDLSKPAKSVGELDRTKKDLGGKTEYDRWNPGPGFEKHNVYEITRSIPALAQTRAAGEVPTLYCVLSAPKVEKISTFDFKVRVLEYGYIESKRSSISITGTSIGGLEEVQKPLAGEYTISKKIKSCDSSDNPLTGWCNSQQVLDLGKEYAITKITARAKHGGAGSFCTGQYNVEFRLDDDTIAINGFKNLGTKSMSAQGWGTVSKSFSQSVGGRYVSATDMSISACGYIDALSATITYVKTYGLNVKYTGPGKVKISEAITCGDLPFIPPLCIFNFKEGTQINLTAMPDDGATFAGWRGAGACSGTETTCTITMDSDKSVSAVFKKG